jgi:CBS domain-containing protein
MQVAEIMETDVRTVTIDTPVSEVLVSLADGQVTGLPVVDTRNRHCPRRRNREDCLRPFVSE